MNEKEIAEWLASAEGQAWEVGVYEDAFDEGFENARAIYGGLDMPDELIPTMSDGWEEDFFPDYDEDYEGEL